MASVSQNVPFGTIYTYEKRNLAVFPFCHFSPGLATQLWSDGCVVSGVFLFQDKAMVWRVKSIFSTVECAYLLYK